MERRTWNIGILRRRWQMKRTFVIVLSLLASSLGTQAWAQPAGTKVGVVNMGKLYLGYERVKALKKELDKEMEPYTNQRKQLEDHIKQWKQALQNDANQGGKILTDKQRAEGQKSIIDATRRLEDLDLSVKKEMGKKVENMLTMINKEINEKVQEVAAAHGYQLILAYGEPEQKLPEIAAFQRTMKVIDQGGMVVSYVSSNLDISEEVLQSLNNHYRNLVTRGLPVGLNQK
jgi:Skp family chaperone for outer membrane proteins